MTNGKSYEVTLVNKDKPVKFTVARRIGLAEAMAGAESCGEPDCTAHVNVANSGENGERRKIEAAFTTKNTLVLRRLNYSQNRAESHQVFESVPHLIANLNSALPEEVLLSAQLTTFNETGMTASELAKKNAEEEAKKNAPEEI